MFLHHPDSLLDLARLEQAERNRHFEQPLHRYSLRVTNRPARASRSQPAVRRRLAHLLRALANRLQPESAEPRTAPSISVSPRPFAAQRLRQHARSHAMAIARRHDLHRLDAA